MMAGQESQPETRYAAAMQAESGLDRGGERITAETSRCKVREPTAEGSAVAGEEKPRQPVWIPASVLWNQGQLTKTALLSFQSCHMVVL